MERKAFGTLTINTAIVIAVLIALGAAVYRPLVLDRTMSGDGSELAPLGVDTTDLVTTHAIRRYAFLPGTPSPRPARWIFLDNLCVDQAIPELREVQAAFLERHRSYVVDEDQGLVLLHFPNVPNPSE